MALHWRAWVVAASCSFGLACSDDGLPQEGGAETGSTSGNNTDNPTTASATGTSVTGSSSTTGVPTTSESDTTGPTTGPETGSTGGETEMTGSSGETDTDTDATGSSSSSSGSTSETDSSSSSGSTTGDAEHYEGTFEGFCDAVMLDIAGTLELDIMGDGTVEGTFMTDIDSGTFDGTVDDMGAIEASGSGMVAGDCTFDGQIDMAGDITGVWECPTFECTGTWEASPT